MHVSTLKTDKKKVPVNSGKIQYRTCTLYTQTQTRGGDRELRNIGGILQKVETSEWATPIVAVPKKN